MTVVTEIVMAIAEATQYGMDDFHLYNYVDCDAIITIDSHSPEYEIVFDFRGHEVTVSPSTITVDDSPQYRQQQTPVAVAD